MISKEARHRVDTAPTKWLGYCRSLIGRGCCAVPNAGSGILISWSAGRRNRQLIRDRQTIQICHPVMLPQMRSPAAGAHLQAVGRSLEPGANAIGIELRSRPYPVVDQHVALR